MPPSSKPSSPTLITGKRKLAVPPPVGRLPKGTKYRFGVTLSPDLHSTARKIGFTEPFESGQQVLPPSLFGPTSVRNANGSIIVHKDRPMETAYRQKVWTWEQWHGRTTETKSKIVDVPYKRYHRTEVPPLGEELAIASDADGELVIVTMPSTSGTTPDDLGLHRLNLALEIFGRSYVYIGDLHKLKSPAARRVNWEVLPPGKYPWAKVKPQVRAIIKLMKDQVREMAEWRLARISEHEPDFVAIGRAGFAGHIVFGFPKKELFILESVYLGNATYVFDRDWEELSRKTKAEILDAKLHKARLIHRLGWSRQLNDLFK